MLYNAKSRRHFLTGAGQLALALPALPSLMPRSAWGAPMRSPLRFVMSQSYFGQMEPAWLPKFTALDPLDTGLKGAELTKLPGSISKVLGPSFDALKGKMNVVNGLGVLHEWFAHQTSGAICASGVIGGPQGFDQRPKSGQPSVQYIFANSPKVYPDGDAGLLRHLAVSRGYNGQLDAYEGVADFTRNNKGYGMGGVVTNAKALYQRLAGSFNPNAGSTTNPATDPVVQSRIKMVQDVYQDYKSVVGGGQLSAADRPRFEAYMALIAEVEKGLSTPVKSCADPKPALAPDAGHSDPASLDDPTNGWVAGDRDCAKILAAALACQLSSVVDFNIVPDMKLHSWQHMGNVEQHSDYMARYARSIAYLWTQMDGLKDADGRSVLDNSIAIFTNGDGNWPHWVQNLPIATAGSLGGRLRTGYFLDYRIFEAKPGDPNGNYKNCRPYNNFLVTMFNAFGLTPADYYDTGQGYGEYNPHRCSLLPAELTTLAAKRQPLPFMLKA